jgi:hypothetical protein
MEIYLIYFVSCVILDDIKNKDIQKEVIFIQLIKD